MYIGLLMINGENDILTDTLAHNLQWIDTFYALDGTLPNHESLAICEQTGKLGGYLQDKDLSVPPFTPKPRCGYRKAIHDLAVSDHGPDHTFVILHGDETWTSSPQTVAASAPRADGFILNAAPYFPRAGEPWNYNQPPLQQLRWSLKPGWPEFRMFHGRHGVGYSEQQWMNAAPAGLSHTIRTSFEVKHYLYRSPDAQRARARQHQETGFDPDNYQHILNDDAVYWTDEMIADRQKQACFRELAFG